MDRWFSSAGGIQTVNRELACALASQHNNIDCIVIVPYANEDEKRDASSKGVRLIEGNDETSWVPVLLSSEVSKIPVNTVLAVIGHSSFSGLEAIRLRDRFFPNAVSVYFVHMNPLATESLKEYRSGLYVSERESRLKKELSLAQMADLVIAIGPRLSAYISDRLLPHQSKCFVKRTVRFLFTHYKPKVLIPKANGHRVTRLKSLAKTIFMRM